MNAISTQHSVERRAKGLGWFSIGLGLAELTMTRPTARLAGVDDVLSTTLLRAMGAREVASGLGILWNPRSSMPLWARVAGDAIDLLLLGRALSSRRSNRTRVAIACGAVAGIAILDALTARQVGRREPSSDAGAARDRIKRTAAVTIRRPRHVVEEAWSRMRDERPVEGEPQFREAPGGRGTEVRLVRARGDLRRTEAKLRRLKQLAEIGEIVHSDATVHRGPHAGQPSVRPDFSASAREVLR